MKVELINNDRQLRIVDATEIELKQLYMHFTRKIKNAYFHPLVKKRLWDGNINFIDNNLRLSSGLWNELVLMCEDYSFELELIGRERLVDSDFDDEYFNKWVENFFKDSDIKPRDYQIDAALKILKWKRSISEIATSAGKTLIMFIIFTYLKQHKIVGTLNEDGIKKSFLVIVPNVSLILQTYEAFLGYNNFKSNFKFSVQTFGGGASKIKKDTDIIIGTFQTLSKLPDEYFKSVQVVACDESHFAATKSVKEVFKKCSTATYRFGVSGTTKATNTITAESFTMQSLLGPIINKITPEFLFKNKFATPVKIRMIYLDYLDLETREKLKILKNRKDIEGSKLLNIEKQIIIDSEERLEFITNAIASINKNSLVLFHNVKDQYGKRIQEKLSEILPTTTAIYYVDGGINKDIREEYRKAMENPNKQTIMVASFGTFSTGIDIKNIEYIWLVESFKSEVIIKQSFGRGMRLRKGKKQVQIIDFIDDFSIGKYENYVLKHSYEREELYKTEGFPYKKLYVNF